MEIDVSKQTMHSLAGDAVESAEAVSLVYVTDKRPGISRVRYRKIFEYFYKGNGSVVFNE